MFFKILDVSCQIFILVSWLFLLRKCEVQQREIDDLNDSLSYLEYRYCKTIEDSIGKDMEELHKEFIGLDIGDTEEQK